MVHKIQLPSKVVVYPRGFEEEWARGTAPVDFPRKIFMRSTAYDVPLVVTHETAHKVWEKLSDKEKETFLKRMNLEKRGLPSKLEEQYSKSWKPYLKKYEKYKQTVKKYIKQPNIPKKIVEHYKGVLKKSPLQEPIALESFPRMVTKWVMREEE
jgi:hypothetical protein